MGLEVLVERGVCELTVEVVAGPAVLTGAGEVPEAAVLWLDGVVYGHDGVRCLIAHSTEPRDGSAVRVLWGVFRLWGLLRNRSGWEDTGLGRRYEGAAGPGYMGHAQLHVGSWREHMPQGNCFNLLTSNPRTSSWGFGSFEEWG